MDFGFQLMTRGVGGTAEGIGALTACGEAAGFDYVAVNDHIVVPGDIASRYPYSEDGRWPGATVGECHEQLTALAFIAARTSRLRLLTSVMVVPHRNPVHTAKVLTTIDVLSGGRLTVGCGAGWLREEFEAIGTPPFAERGAVTDEFIAVFKDLWTSPAPRMQGTYSSYGDVVFAPGPAQRPHPPIWIGGESRPALQRAAALGDGWYPASNNPRFPLDTPERFADRRARLGALMEQAGRDPDTMHDALFFIELVDPAARFDEDGSRCALTGPADDIAADLDAFAQAGVQSMVLIFQLPELSATLERMDWFATEVLPLVRH